MFQWSRWRQCRWKQSTSRMGGRLVCKGSGDSSRGIEVTSPTSRKPAPLTSLFVGLWGTAGHSGLSTMAALAMNACSCFASAGGAIAASVAEQRSRGWSSLQIRTKRRMGSVKPGRLSGVMESRRWKKTHQTDPPERRLEALCI